VTDTAPEILPVILCGGAGTRLWPLSTDTSPKHFHAFGSEKSLFQDTVLRLRDEDGARFLAPLIICGRDHGSLVEAQLAEIGVTAAATVLEPCGRNTAPAAAIAAQLAAERHPQALILLAPADHQIAKGQVFRQTIARSARVARDYIVTFGIKPSRPETGYGYIQCADPLAPGVFSVARFVEKPGAAEAQNYLEQGDYAWNAGIFLFSPEVFLRELRAHRPDIADYALAALPAERKGTVIGLDDARFRACPAESIDYAVMEHTRKAAVAPCEIGWTDVGSWNEVWRLGAQDGAANVSRGSVITANARGSLIWSDGPIVAAIGVEDLIIVATKDAVLVMPKSQAQALKAVVEALPQDASSRD
jgi:mannose-1-phosphate guanylyltransferase / mannose-6-phosphate isomerase